MRTGRRPTRLPAPSRPRGVWLGAEVDPGRLQLRVLIHGVQRLVPAEAGLLVAAEGRGDVAGVEAVDPDDAGPQRAGRPVRLGDVAGPHRGGQAVDGVVADPDRLVDVLHADGREHRPEDLFLGDLHPIVDVVEDGRLYVETALVGVRPLAAHPQRRALRLAGLDVTEHALHLRLVDDRPHPGLRVQRIAGLERL